MAKTTVPHTPEVKKRALELYQKIGATAAARQTGVPRSTISRWVQLGHIPHFEVADMKAMQEAADLSRRARRDRISERLLVIVEGELNRIHQPYVEFRTPAGIKSVDAQGEYKPIKITHREPPPGERKNIMMVAAIAIDKAQLLAGEATSRSEHVSIKEIEEAFGEALDETGRKHVALTILKGRTRGVGGRRAREAK